MVAAMADRQQRAVFGVEHEEAAVQQDERGLAGGGAPFGTCGVGGRVAGGDGGDEFGEGLVEDRFGQAFRDAGFVAAASFQGAIEEGAAGGVGAMRFRAQQQEKGAERGAAGLRGGGEDGGQIGLDKAFRLGWRAFGVEAPEAAVGEQPPADGALRAFLGKPEVAKQLGGGGAAIRIRAVERALPRLVFLHEDGARVSAGAAVRLAGGGFLVGRVGEEQRVRDVGPLGAGALLREVVPAEGGEDGEDQVGFGLGLVRRGAGGKGGNKRGEAVGEGVDLGVRDGAPVVGFGQGVVKKGAGEEAAFEPRGQEGRGGLGHRLL